MQLVETVHAGIPADLARAMSDYADLLLRWNARINLTAATRRDDALQHIADCMALVRAIPADAGRLVDIGSGGGLPAVVIAIGRPALHVLAVEPIAKKHAFLRTAARELRLANLEAVAARVEDVAPGDFDVASSRATFAIAEWMDRGMDLVRDGGVVLGMEAVDQMPLGRHDRRLPYPFGDRTRAIIVREKPV